MKPVIAALLLCFISGTLCYTLINSMTNDVSSLLSRKVRYITPNQNGDNFDDQLEAFLIKVKEKCDAAAGNEDAFNTLMEDFLKFLNCVTPLIDNFDVNMLVNFHDDSDTFNVTAVRSLLETLCPVQRQAFLCINNLTYTADICLESRERELKNNLVNYAKGLGGFVCKGNGEPVLQFFNDGGIECLNETLPNLMHCRENFNDIVESSNFLFTLDETLCNELKVERNCIVKSLGECNRPVIKQIYSDYFNATWNATSCNTYYKSKK